MGLEEEFDVVVPEEELEWMIANHRQKPRELFTIGVSTMFFSQAMTNHPSPFELDAKFEEWMQQRAKRYCDLVNRTNPPEANGELQAMRPRLFNYSSRVIVLKP